MATNAKVVLGSLLLMMVCEMLAAHHSDWLTQKQVVARWGEIGIPFSIHGGVYGDVLILQYLAAWIIQCYWAGTSPKILAVAITIGIVLTVANGINLAINQHMPDPFGFSKEKFSLLVGLHAVYMITLIAVLGVFFFSNHVSIQAAIAVSIIVGLHVAFGMHIPIGIVNRLHPLEKCPDFLANPVLPWMWLFVWALLAGFSCKAAGWQAGAWVASIGTGLVSLLLLFVRFGPPALQAL